MFVVEEHILVMIFFLLGFLLLLGFLCVCVARFMFVCFACFYFFFFLNSEYLYCNMKQCR